MVPLQSLEIWNEGGFWHRVEQFVGAQQKVSLHQHRMVRIMMISIVMITLIMMTMERGGEDDEDVGLTHRFNTVIDVKRNQFFLFHSLLHNKYNAARSSSYKVVQILIINTVFVISGPRPGWPSADWA